LDRLDKMIISQYIIILASLIGLILYLILRKGCWNHVVVALLFTSFWVSLSGLYNYQETNLIFYGINLFPFFAWIGGLVLVRLVYEHLGEYKLVKTAVLYWAALLSLEYVGYNYLYIRLSSDYPGLFGLELMHIPPYAQAYYLFVAPVYLLVLMALDKPSRIASRSETKQPENEMGE
jgi:hypothetical protein